jgi:VWFA-related protein
MRYLMIFAFAASLAAQEKLAETIEVHVVNVDVVVTDRAGNPVPGLTKDDFEILENGKPQPITNFYEVRPDAATVTVSAAPNAPATAKATAATVAPDDIRARRFAICLDNYSLEPIQRNSVLAALRKFVEANMKPGDEMSLMLWARKIETVTPLTNNKAEILKGIDSLASRSRAGMSAGQEEERARQKCRETMQEVDEQDTPQPSDGSNSRGSKPRVSFTWEDAWIGCDGTIQAFADSEWANARALIGDLKSMVSTLAGIDGRKVLVLAGAHLPEHPGRESSLWMVQQFLPYQKFLKRTTNVNKGFGQSGSRSQVLAVDDAARFANANGVTFYMIDAADTRNASSAESPILADNTDAFMSFTDTASAYHALATFTGGAALSNTQNFDSAFQTLARDLTSFYSIGYKPSEGGKDDRKIVVRAKKSGLIVRARQTFTPKSPEQEMNDRVIANVLHHGANGEWPVRLTAQTPEKSGDLYKLPITIEMDPKVTLLPQEEKMVGGFVLYIVVGTHDGAMSKVTRSARKIEMPPARESEFRAKPMTYTLMLSVRPGENIVSVGVVDQISNVSGFARADVVAQ